MAVSNICSESEFAAAVEGNNPAVVHFWASWCEPCQHMDTVLRQLAAENTHACFVRVEAEQHPEILERFGVATVPTFLFFQGARVVDRMEGLHVAILAHKVAVHVSRPDCAPGSSDSVCATVSTAQIINTLRQVLETEGKVPSTCGFPLRAC